MKNTLFQVQIMSAEVLLSILYTISALTNLNLFLGLNTHPGNTHPFAHYSEACVPDSSKNKVSGRISEVTRQRSVN